VADYFYSAHYLAPLATLLLVIINDAVKLTEGIFVIFDLIEENKDGSLQINLLKGN